MAAISGSWSPSAAHKLLVTYTNIAIEDATEALQKVDNIKNICDWLLADTMADS